MVGNKGKERVYAVVLMTMMMLISNLTSGYKTDYGMLMLAVLITTIPTAVVFFALQKYFVEGITGSVK